MTRPRVAIVGGGLSGLAAALGCADRGAAVTLIESRRWLGGAAYSRFVDGAWIDNGQHVFLRCCTAFRGFIDRIGSTDQAHLQNRLSIPLVSPGGTRAELGRDDLPPPLHLARGLFALPGFTLRQRLQVVGAVQALGRLELGDRSNDDRSLGEWLAGRGCAFESTARFWELLVRPTLNVDPRQASLAMVAKVFQTGLLESRDGADLGWGRGPLQTLIGEPALRALDAAGAIVRVGEQVEALRRGAGGVEVRCRGEWQQYAAAVVAAPPAVAEKLLPPEAGIDRRGLRNLASDPIVNLHVFYDRRVMDEAFVATIDSPLQWVFDRSAHAPGFDGQYLAISLSAADAFCGMDQRQLRELAEREIPRVFARARGATMTRFLATFEKNATFSQRPGTGRLRCGGDVGVAPIFVAGVWTDTGWPATMEGAVRSGNEAARRALGWLRATEPMGASSAPAQLDRGMAAMSGMEME